MVIEAPFNYERTHELAQCPLCNNPNPVLDMYMPERYLRYFDKNYTVVILFATVILIAILILLPLRLHLNPTSINSRQNMNF